MTGEQDSSITGSPRAFHSPAAWFLLILVLVVGLGADLASKSYSFQRVTGTPVQLDRQQLLKDANYNPIPRHDSVPVLPFNLLHLQLVINRGAVFGMGADKRIFFIVFTLGALIAGLYVFGRYTQQRHRLAHVALGLILAGGLGNLYDRILFGVVRDFLHMLPNWTLPFGWRWPGPGGSPDLFPWVFNVADVMLLVGIGLLMIHINRVEKERQHLEETETNASEEAPPQDSPPEIEATDSSAA